MKSDSATKVAIVGSGPYGLSLASHLSHRKLEHRIFGSPMQTWRNMLPDIGLKSLGWATNIYAPQKGFKFADYCRGHGKTLEEPIAMTLFAAYGLWAQQRLVPELETSHVSRVELADRGFQVTLETGERLLARRVVMATGLAHYHQIPGVFSGLPEGLVSHTSQHSDVSGFRGKDVTVIGAGASALEAATLLYEGGATVRLLLRRGRPRFGGRPVEPRPLKERLIYPKSVLGPGRLNFLLERAPTAVHHLLSDEPRVKLAREHLGPLGAWWLRERFEGNVPFHSDCEVVEAREAGSGLRLRVKQAGAPDWELDTDHVICGTGYEVDPDRHPVLDEAITRRLQRVVRAPRLSSRFESSVPGLYFIGVASTFSFGPLFRFVAGAAFAAPALARHLAGAARSEARAGDRVSTALAPVD